MLTETRPDVVLITCHDLGRHLGCYGARSVTSPALDALAADGVRFERAFTVSPSCSPSRAAMATGRYPHCNGVMGLAHPPFGWDLGPAERHMAGILREAAYETHLFGFQHVTTEVARLGFDHLHGFEHLQGCHATSLGRDVAEQVGIFLRNAPSHRPLYLEINLEEPHRPYDQGGARPDASKGVIVPPYLPDGAAAREETAAFQGAIRQADAGVGQILASLREAGFVENTLVVFVADHGAAMPRAKCTLYDPGLEIALIMRWPAARLTGSRPVAEMVSNIDILPTILELIDLPIPPRVQGQSFLPFLRETPSASRSEIYAEKTYHSYYDPMRAVRTERFKYIRNFETTFAVEVPADVQLGPIFRRHVERYHSTEHVDVELYDLNADPWEQANLAGTPALGEVERALDDRLWRWMAQTQDPLLESPVPSPSQRRAQAAFRHIGL